MHVKLADESPLLHLYWEMVGALLGGGGGRGVIEKKVGEA